MITIMEVIVIYTLGIIFGCVLVGHSRIGDDENNDKDRLI